MFGLSLAGKRPRMETNSMLDRPEKTLEGALFPVFCADW